MSRKSDFKMTRIWVPFIVAYQEIHKFDFYCATKDLDVALVTCLQNLCCYTKTYTYIQWKIFATIFQVKYFIFEMCLIKTHQIV